MTWLSDPDLCMILIFRFHPDEKAKRNPLVHIPFGWGPRNCVGLRFALMEAKMAMLSVLKKFKFERAPETEVLSCLYSAVTSFIIYYCFICRFPSRADWLSPSAHSMVSTSKWWLGYNRNDSRGVWGVCYRPLFMNINFTCCRSLLCMFGMGIALLRRATRKQKAIHFKEFTFPGSSRSSGITMVM